MGQQMNINRLNADLCRVLGISDLHNVRRVELAIQAQQVPVVTVTSLLLRDGVSDETVASFELVPVIGPPELPSSIERLEAK